jgi:hypothetical protein
LAPEAESCESTSERDNEARRATPGLAGVDRVKALGSQGFREWAVLASNQ